MLYLLYFRILQYRGQENCHAFVIMFVNIFFVWCSVKFYHFLFYLFIWGKVICCHSFNAWTYNIMIMVQKATGSYRTYSVRGKTAALVAEFAVEDLSSEELQPRFLRCSEGPALGQNTLMMIYSFLPWHYTYMAWSNNDQYRPTDVKIILMEK